MGGRGLGSITKNASVDLFINTILLLVIMILIIAISVSFIKAVVARVKVEQTLKFFWTIPTGLALLSLLLVYLKL
jgi:NADH-quinone oxidoreductase subunit H